MHSSCPWNSQWSRTHLYECRGGRILWAIATYIIPLYQGITLSYHSAKVSCTMVAQGINVIPCIYTMVAQRILPLAYSETVLNIKIIYYSPCGLLSWIFNSKVHRTSFARQSICGYIVRLIWNPQPYYWNPPSGNPGSATGVAMIIFTDIATIKYRWDAGPSDCGPLRCQN